MLLQIIVIAIVTYVFTIYILPPPVDTDLVKSACDLRETADRYRSIILGSCNNGELDCNVETLDELQDSEDTISDFESDYCRDISENPPS